MGKYEKSIEKIYCPAGWASNSYLKRRSAMCMCLCEYALQCQMADENFYSATSPHDDSSNGTIVAHVSIINVIIADNRNEWLHGEAQAATKQHRRNGSDPMTVETQVTARISFNCPQ